MNKKKLFIIASILAAIGLVVMLFMLPKPKTNNSAKHETSTETSTSKKNDKKDDKKDNKQDEKKDSKKDDKKEDKKEDTSTTSETPVTPTTGTTSTETQNNNNSSSVTNTPSTNTTPAPQPIYQTIHHDAVGHWETQVIQDAWDQPIYERKIIGNNTGTIYNSVSEWGDNANGDEGYHVGDVQVGTTHHEAVTQEVWVVDQEAWDQIVIVGYR
ncbi:hypothetical protein [uncultured Solobacterium sp.]|uniref:hypothetical protein n=1 Tax=uncultured Solobacterium sp. TaxID=747375 RepID=UPI00261BCB1C|nr:hypothetical protein [uncultured Solobacterium sp.]